MNKRINSPKNKWEGGGKKIMCFHLKIYVMLFNSFCVFLLEHIDAFWMFLQLPAIKNNTIIQNKEEDRISVTSSSWARLTNAWKLFKPNKPTRQLSFWEFKILRLFTIIDYIYTSKYTSRSYKFHYSLILTDAKSFSPGTVLPLLNTSVKPSC